MRKRGSSRVIGIVGCKSLLLATMALLAPCAAANAQGTPLLLLVSQPGSSAGSDRFVDLAPHLQPALQESGRYNILVFRTTDQAIQNAVKAGLIKASEIQPPLSHDAAHRVAKALSATAILYVSADAAKDGVGMTVEMETLTGQTAWGQVYQDKVAATKEAGKRASLLEHIHALVDRIKQRVLSAQTPVSTTQITRVDPTPNPNTAPPATLPDKTGAVPPKANGAVKPPTDAGPPPVKPDNFSTYELTIDRARRNGDLATLILALRRAINERPREVRLRRELASAYKERGWIDMAKEESLRAASLAPDDGSVHRLIGDVLRDSGDVAGALKEYQAAVRLSPQDPASHMALGDALMADGHNDDAMKSFDAAAKADPKSPAPYLRIARLSVRKGAYTEAAAALTAAKSLAVNSDNAAFLTDCGAILTVVESTLTETLPRMQQARVGFANGTRTREDAFKDVTALRKRIDDLSTFLDAMPDVGLSQPQALYAQAASIAVQAADKLLEHLETQSTSAAAECNLLRIEANKQIGEAAKRLKSALDARTTRT